MSKAPLPADLLDLVRDVIAEVPHLLALQDKDPDSPMRGCMHPAYWRDKSSEVADMRRQEAALAFAWLWKFDFPGNSWHRDREILRASLRALGFWSRNQHRDGTFDEWYKNEHGYATTAFSCYAVALTIEALGPELSGPLRDDVLRALRRGGSWLTTHDDWFKTNHQAVGVAALGAAGRVLGEQSFLDAARRNAGQIVERMHAEGWSREISGADLGYTFLLAEYLAMHAVLTGERQFLEKIAKAYRFASDFFHPDLTTGAEYGICANPYFSRVATVALAPFEPSARAILEWMERERPSPRPRDTTSTLKDDLRLARYAYQPLLAALLYQGHIERMDQPALPVEAASSAPSFLLASGRAFRPYPSAGLAAIARPGYVAWIAAAYGGALRVAFRRGAEFAPAVLDRGYVLDLGGDVYRNARYDLKTSADLQEAACVVHAPLVRCGFVLPPTWARVGLRIATSLPYGPRWSRWLIDQWRRRKGTALNQSTAGIARGSGRYTLKRTVRFLDEHLEIEDRLSTSEPSLDRNSLHLVLDGPWTLEGAIVPDVDRRVGVREVRNVAIEGQDLVIRKVVTFEHDSVRLAFRD